MNATELLSHLGSLGVAVEVRGDKLRLTPGSLVPRDVLEGVRLHKPELQAILKKPRLVEGPPEWHAREVADRVEIDGVCIFWSEVLADVVAFYRTEEDRARIPVGIVGYSIEELTRLFGPGEVAESALQLIHHAKKLGGGRVVGNDPAGTQPGESRP